MFIHWPKEDWVASKFSDLFSFEGFDICEDEYLYADNTVNPKFDLVEEWRLYVDENDGIAKEICKNYRSMKNGYSIDFEYETKPSSIKGIYLDFFNHLVPSKMVEERIKAVELPDNYVAVQVRNASDWDTSNRSEKLDAFLKKWIYLIPIHIFIFLV